MLVVRTTGSIIASDTLTRAVKENRDLKASTVIQYIQLIPPQFFLKIREDTRRFVGSIFGRKPLNVERQTLNGKRKPPITALSPPYPPLRASPRLRQALLKSHTLTDQS